MTACCGALSAIILTPPPAVVKGGGAEVDVWEAQFCGTVLPHMHQNRCRYMHGFNGVYARMSSKRLTLLHTPI